MRLFSVSNSSLFLIFAVYLLFAGLAAATWLPMCDEAWFANPADNLVNHGFFGTTVLDETAGFRQVRLDGINQYTYWVMPLYPLALAAWGEVLGFGLWQSRLFSVLCGGVILGSWFVIIKRLTGEINPALLAILLLAVDFQFDVIAGFGRMDALTNALGGLATAVYLSKREHQLTTAILQSHLLAAAAFFTHPLGLILILNLVIAVFYFDRRRLKLKHLIFAAAPYLIGAAAWFLYIRQAPELFRLQFGGNASDRWAFFRTPLREIWREIEFRYLYNFGVSADLSFTGHLKVIVLLALLTGIGGVLWSPVLRRSTACRLLLLWAAQTAATLLILDSMKQWMYLIYILLPLTAILAIWLHSLWQKGKFARIFAVALIAVVITIGIGTTILRAKRNAVRQNFYAAADFINHNALPDDKIFASAEFWFVINHRQNLIDDYRLGFRSGKSARFIISDAQRYRDWMEQLKIADPPNYEFAQRLLAENYDLIYQDEIYRIYRRRD